MQVTGLQAGAMSPAPAVIAATLSSTNSDNAAQSTAVQTTARSNDLSSASEAAAGNADDANAIATTPTGKPGILPLKNIVTGNNPRGYFDEKEMNELTESVRVNGIVQAITVRPLSDGTFAIIAGERRYRAAKAAHGDDYPMPVLIVDCTEEQAAVMAHIENTMRADMSPTEEAVSAAKIVGQVKSNRDEAARLLGWSRAKLDSRLALMNCSDNVRKALDERKVLLGHAELFAALAKPNQDKLLEAVLERKISVPDLKALIEKAACKLSSAIFDKSDCVGCKHNSSVQATMFEACITDGGCTNRSCYDSKTEAHLDGMKEALKEEYPVIRIVRVGDNFAQVTIKADGPTGIGQAQAEECRGCADFGAAISAIPEHLGKTFKNQCFNPVCNQKKVAEHIRAVTEAKAAEAAQASEVAGDAPTKTGPKGAAKDAEKAKPAEAKTSVAEGPAVTAYREKLWRSALRKELAKDYDVSVNYLLSLALTGNIRHVSQEGLTSMFERLLGDKRGKAFDNVANQVGTLSPDRRDTLLQFVTVSAMSDLPVQELVRLAKHIKLDLTKHWRMDEEFLKLFSKVEIQLISKKVGLDKAFGDGFTKLFSEKKDDIIKKLLSVKDFDYSATIPAAIMYK